MKSAAAILYLLVTLIAFSCGTSDVQKDFESVSIIELRGIPCYNRLNEAQVASSKSGKPLFVIFDSPVVGCCRRSTDLVFEFLRSNSKVRNKYEVVYLQLDDKTEIKSDKELKLGGELRKVRTVGDENALLMIEMFDMLTSYYFTIFDAELKSMKEPIGSFSSEKDIANYLQQ